MTTKCPDCNRTYDDARCWTICPHNPLDVGVDAKYCRKHDLFNCYLCQPNDPLPPAEPESSILYPKK